MADAALADHLRPETPDFLAWAGDEDEDETEHLFHQYHLPNSVSLHHACTLSFLR